MFPTCIVSIIDIVVPGAEWRPRLVAYPGWPQIFNRKLRHFLQSTFQHVLHRNNLYIYKFFCA